MLLNCKQCYKKCYWITFALKCFYCPQWFSKIMIMTQMLALMKVYFPLLYVEWCKWMPQNVIEWWLKCKNCYLNLIHVQMFTFHTNECIFALLVAISHKWQQKVYYIFGMICCATHITVCIGVNKSCDSYTIECWILADISLYTHSVSISVLLKDTMERRCVDFIREKLKDL